MRAQMSKPTYAVGDDAFIIPKARHQISTFKRTFLIAGPRDDVGIVPYMLFREYRAVSSALYIFPLIVEIRISPATTRSSGAKPSAKLSE